MSRVKIKDQKDAIFKVFLADSFVAEAHFHTNLRKTESLRGNGWIKIVGDQLAMDQTPRIIGDNIKAKAKRWKLVRPTEL